MANLAQVRRQPVEVELDKVRHLKYTLGSFANLEEKYGSVDEAFNALGKGGFKDIIYFLYEGLRHEDKSLTAETTGEIIDFRDMELVMNLVNKALGQDGPGADTVVEGEVSPN